MRPDPNEALEIERDNLRTELAAARKVIAAGYGSCESCRFWERDVRPEPDPPWGECELFADPEYGERHDDTLARAWGGGYEVDSSGFATRATFGCVSFEPLAPSTLTLPPLEIGEAPSAPSRLIVTEHPFPVVQSNHL